jgi:hypothetical protein
MHFSPENDKKLRLLRKLAISALKSHIPAMRNANYSLKTPVPGANAMQRCALLFVGLAALAISGCEPAVQISARDKSVIINLNDKIGREV